MARPFLYATGSVAVILGLAACQGFTGTTLPAGGSATAGQASTGGLPRNVVRACAPSRDPDVDACLALIRTDLGAGPTVSGYGPSQLRSAYGLPSATQGKGQTVAIVDAYDDPNAESDLAVYRSNFGLSKCSTSNGCFMKVNQKGQQGPYPSPNGSWAVEESLDVDMISAICPNCHIILVESNNSRAESLGKAVDEAVRLGADEVSNSYIGYGQRGTKNEPHYQHPGVIETAGGGDAGFRIGEPAGFPEVVSVGGTTLLSANNSRGWTETVWGGTGSGCEGRLAKPSWQIDKGCKGRTMNDVAAVADPNTGVAVYDTYPSGGWFVIGGTSVATPVIAGVYALAGNANKQDAAKSLYAKGALLWDVTSGSNGTCHHAYLCNGERGYDGPTGNGTPNGVSAF